MPVMDMTTTTTTTQVMAFANSTQYVLSPEENATIQRLNEARASIFASYMWVIFILGFPGNVACVLTVISMSTLSTATLYVALLAVVDALTLLGKLVAQQLTYHQSYLGDSGCKATSIINIFNCYAHWVLVLVCFERFLAVRWPLKKAVFFTKSRAWLIAAVLFIVIFLIYTQLFVLYISDPTGRICGFSDEVGSYVRLWYWFSAFLFSLAPFILLVVFTTFIVTGLWTYRAARKSILDNKRSDNSNMERAISVMMSVAAIVFLLLTLPNCIFIVAFDYWSWYPPVSYARWMLFQQVSFVLSDLNHAINFYLYFLTADKFRTRFKYMITCRRVQHRKKSDVTSIGDHTQYTRANSMENIAMTRV
ncbi:uncharacterized protein LOC143300713 [Babylonia areolata]|uniref:uncharacterized protein LOC143300713 n=1 Tax=Babylonia areolata TaxID=304850 RepID=UPI003FD2267C